MIYVTGDTHGDFYLRDGKHCMLYDRIVGLGEGPED